MPRTAAELIKAAITVFFLVVIVIIVGLNEIHQSPAYTSLDSNSREAIQNTEDNFILGMVILGILGTFGIIAYYYTTIGLGSTK